MKGKMPDTNVAITRDRLIADLKTVVSDLEALLKELAGELGEKGKQLARRLATALESAKANCAQLQEKAEAGAHAADKLVHEHPYTPRVAFGVGMLIGVLVRSQVMPEPDHDGLFSSVRGLPAILAAVLRNRIELLAVEWQEERLECSELCCWRARFWCSAYWRWARSRLPFCCDRRNHRLARRRILTGRYLAGAVIAAATVWKRLKQWTPLPPRETNCERIANGWNTGIERLARPNRPSSPKAPSTVSSCGWNWKNYAAPSRVESTAGTALHLGPWLLPLISMLGLWTGRRFRKPAANRRSPAEIAGLSRSAPARGGLVVAPLRPTGCGGRILTESVLLPFGRRRALRRRIGQTHEPERRCRSRCGKGDFDLVLAQFAFDGEIEFAAETARVEGHLRRPDRQFEIERAVAKTAEENRGRGFAQARWDARAATSSRTRLQLLQIAAVRHAQRQPDAAPADRRGSN